MAAFFQNGVNPLMVSWRPQLRETSDDIGKSWEVAAARAVESIQNSGFIARAVEVAAGATVGSGLRISVRPDAVGLGWDQEKATKWANKVESRFRAWAESPTECDAGGKMTFYQMQQAAFGCFLRDAPDDQKVQFRHSDEGQIASAEPADQQE
jgi:capsid protein